MKNILITGCSSGVGKAAALLFSNKGYRVFAGVRTKADANALVAADDAGNLVPLILDLTDPEQRLAAVSKLESELGEAGLDAIVNNAGIAKFVPLEFAKEADVRQMVEVNTMGPVLLTQSVLPLIRKAGGRVVIIGSIGGRISFSFNGPYSISKFALAGYADALRRELEPFGLKVSLLEPGSIATPMLDKVQQETEQAISELSVEARELYENDLRNYTDTLPTSKTYAATAEKVAEVIAHAVESPRPKARYLVTPDSRSLIFMNWLLPVRLFDPLLKKMTALGKLIE